MSTISSQEIISIIKSEIENFDMHAGQEQETGSVIWVGDGIAIVYGIEHAMKSLYLKMVLREWSRISAGMRLAVSFSERIQEWARAPRWSAPGKGQACLWEADS